MEHVTTADVAIIGAGPIGLEMAAALKRAGVDYLHLEARQVGYTVSWFPPQTRFFSSNERIAIAGVPLQTPDGGKCTREQYLTYLRTVVEQFDLHINTYEPVVGIERLPAGNAGTRGAAARFELTTRPAGGARRYRCNRLILATGGTDHPRRLNVPGEDLPHVHRYFGDPHAYFRRRVLVVGGKNSAVEAALRCHNAGARVTISYRRDRLPDKSIKYWLLPEINGLVAAGRIDARFSTVPVAIHPTRVTLAATNTTTTPTHDSSPNAADGAAAAAVEDVPADFVLPLIGYEQDATLFRLVGLALSPECRAPLFDEQTMEASVPGVHVIGTAVGGTQDKYTVFIENCHVHVARVVAAITGTAAPQADVEPAVVAMPES
jgi:thioredoxin reductase (NADPH)